MKWAKEKNHTIILPIKYWKTNALPKSVEQTVQL